MDNKKLKKQIYDIWAEHETYIRKLCTYKLKSFPDYIDDCIQDVFLDLSDALNKGKTIEYPKAWLTKVANNKLMFDVIDKVMINANGDISIHFVNNTVLCHEKGEFVNAAC